MALVRQRLQEASQNRASGNKEPEWSSLCDNVFDEFLNQSDQLFDLAPTDMRGRSSSGHSSNLFDFSASSEQSHCTANTAATSPILAETTCQAPWPKVDMTSTAAAPATQPKPKESVGFWRRTLRVLERSAAKTEGKQQHLLRNSKSHPDFLSLGGNPSPPPLPPSPTDQSLSVQRRRVHTSANGTTTVGTPHASHTVGRSRAISGAPTAAKRSVSRGRQPIGVTKHHYSSAASQHPTPASSHAACHHNPYATVRVRNASSSPHKMMNPSRYRAGFKDVWADRLEASAKQCDVRWPSHGLPVSPPPSGRCMQDDFTGFGSPPPAPTMNPLAVYDEQLSPLTNTFQHANIHTPLHSPFLSPNHTVQQHSYFEPLTAHAAQWAGDTAPLDGGAPVFTERSASLGGNKLQHFDFGFSSGSDEIDGWNASLGEPSASTWGSFGSNNDPFGGVNPHAAMPPSTSSFEAATAGSTFGNAGLGISCDPAVAMPGPNYVTSPCADVAAMPPNPYHGMPSAERSTLNNGYYMPAHQRAYSHGGPITPPRTRRSSSLSPPATAATHSRPRSSSRHASRHRRKSTNCTPRQSSSIDKGAFVNFTPHDSTKILSGVAPSGSSKTKARREKEAADRRRRLSQAAVKAVVEAGGNVESLQAAGLLG